MSCIALGCLSFSHLQQDYDAETGGEIILYALEQGIDTFDTAQLYENYHHIAYANKHTDKKIKMLTKSYAFDASSADNAVREALEQSGLDHIETMMMHECESIYNFRGHLQAIEHYNLLKEKGYINNVGVSTHFSSCVEALCCEGKIDAIETIVNKNSLGIREGNVFSTLDSLEKARLNGKKVYAMKIFGGGNLCKDTEACLDFAKSHMDGFDKIIIGMHSKEEIDYNLSYLESAPLKKKPKGSPKRLLIEDWCIGCGNCVERCAVGALSLVDGKAQVDRSKCLLCGYCSTVCKDFFIKII